MEAALLHEPAAHQQTDDVAKPPETAEAAEAETPPEKGFLERLADDIGATSKLGSRLFCGIFA